MVLAGVWSKPFFTPLIRLLHTSRFSKTDGDEFHEVSFAEESFGEFSEIESSIEDIRNRLKSRTESLSVEREELATLMGAISDGILAVDLEGGPLFFNSKFALLFGGVGFAERKPRLFELFRNPEILDAFDRALKKGQTVPVKPVAIELKEGRRYFSISVSPLRRESDGIYGAVGIFHDVTELKTAEQMRIDFVANVSHELRTPLTSIKGFTDTIIDDIRSQRPVENAFLEKIAKNSDRLLNLINDLLDLSSLDAADDRADLLHRGKVGTREITERILHGLKDSFAKKRQKISTEFDAGMVTADSKRLEQVLINLLENAYKYAPDEGEIAVAWKKDGEDVLLRVYNSGPGIPREHHPRLFERFYRVDKGRSREMGGTGLGLAIVKHILQRHGGTVWVESKEGRGATFVCKFPG